MFKQYLALCAIASASAKHHGGKKFGEKIFGESNETASTSDHWAVIVAGSNQFYNYRHQSDTCHAFQIMKANGIPEDQIIHIAYDDIADNVRNPFKGKIFNKPTEAGTP